MSNRYMNQFAMSLEASKVFLFAKGVVDSSGDVSLTPARESKGFASIDHNGVGDYTIVLQDTYVRLLGLNITSQSASGIPANNGVYIVAEAVSDPAQKTIDIGVYDHAGSAVDFNEEAILVEVILSNSSAP